MDAEDVTLRLEAARIVLVQGLRRIADALERMTLVELADAVVLLEPVLENLRSIADHLPTPLVESPDPDGETTRGGGRPGSRKRSRS